MKKALLKLYKLTFPFALLWIVYAFMHSNEFTWHFWAGVIAYIFVGFGVVGMDGVSIIDSDELSIDDRDTARDMLRAEAGFIDNSAH